MKGAPPPQCTQLSKSWRPQADDPNAPVTIFINSGGGLVELAGCQWIRDCLWKSKDFLLILKHWLLNCANKSSKDFVGKRMARSIAVWLFWTSWQTFLHPWRPCLCFKKKACENSLATHMVYSCFQHFNCPPVPVIDEVCYGRCFSIAAVLLAAPSWGSDDGLTFQLST